MALENSITIFQCIITALTNIFLINPLSKVASLWPTDLLVIHHLALEKQFDATAHSIPCQMWTTGEEAEAQSWSLFVECGHPVWKPLINTKYEHSLKLPWETDVDMKCKQHHFLRFNIWGEWAVLSHWSDQCPHFIAKFTRDTRAADIS